MDWVEPLGFGASALIIISWILQVQKSFKTKSTGDLSWGMVGLLFTSQVMWIAYGLMINSMPVVLTNAASALSVGVLLLLKLKYG
jgi:MtN3 and saliva related transmembrane protein